MLLIGVPCHRNVQALQARNGQFQSQLWQHSNISRITSPFHAGYEWTVINLMIRICCLQSAAIGRPSAQHERPWECPPGADVVTTSGYRNNWRPTGKYRRCAARRGARKGTEAKLAARLMLKLARPTPTCRYAILAMLQPVSSRYM